MSDSPETWPPAPNPQGAAPAAEIKTCPSCQRRLLTHSSMLCNWCGAKINDPEYLARAAAERHALDAQERAQVEALAQEEARYGVFGRLKRRAKAQPGDKLTP